MEKAFKEGSLAHDWTRLVNGVFIWLVFISHFGIISGFGADSSSYFAWQLVILGQLIVTPFLFFSGYGLMVNLKRDYTTYKKKLISQRFPNFWLTYVAIALFCAWVRWVSGDSFTWTHLLLTITGWAGVGPPSWYVFMMLFEYLLIWLAFSVSGEKRVYTGLCLVIAGTMVSIFVLGWYKPFWWYNTILCLPAGMLYALSQDKCGRLLLSLRWMIWVLAILCMLLGCFIHHSAAGWCCHLPVLRVWSGSILSNIGAIVFVFGIAMFVMKITSLVPRPNFKGATRFIYWSGGSSLIYLFMLHNLTIYVGKKCELFMAFPWLYFMSCVAVTLLMTKAIVYVAGLRRNKVG